MDQFNEIIVSYDISNNKMRKKFHDLLLDFGLQPIQKSVFWGRVLAPEMKTISNNFPKYINQEDDDSIFLVMVQLSKKYLNNSIGIKSEFFVQNDSYEIV